MGAIASQITSLTIVHSTVYSDTDQRKRQSSASLAFVRGLHRGPVNSPHKWPVTRKMFPFDDVIMLFKSILVLVTPVLRNFIWLYGMGLWQLTILVLYIKVFIISNCHIKICIPLPRWIRFMKFSVTFAFSIISKHWNGTRGWHIFWWKIRTFWNVGAGQNGHQFAADNISKHF